MNVKMFVLDDVRILLSQDYLVEKVRPFQMTSLVGSVERVPTAPVLVGEKDHPSLDKKILEKIKVSTNCLVREFRPFFVKAADENIISDEIGYLKYPFQGESEGTVVLTRKTTIAIFYILFPDIKAVVHLGNGTDGGLVDIQELGFSVYPIPPRESINTSEFLRGGGSSYTWTEVSPINKSSIKVSWSIADEPYGNNVWWGLYNGVMPSWNNLGSYHDWAYLADKRNKYGKEGSKILNVSNMTSGAIYTLAIFKYKWNLMDYQQFTAP